MYKSILHQHTKDNAKLFKYGQENDTVEHFLAYYCVVDDRITLYSLTTVWPPDAQSSTTIYLLTMNMSALVGISKNAPS